MSYKNYQHRDDVITETDLGHRWGRDDAEYGGGVISNGGLLTPEMKAAYAESLLAGIFANVPAGCTEVRLSVRQWFGSLTQGGDVFILTGWIYFGVGTWELIKAQQDQPEISQAMIDAATEGWAMGQKMRSMKSTEFIFPFTPNEGQKEFALHSRTADVGERRRKEEAFARLVA